MECEICGATERIQKHHIQYYNPAIIQYLCVDCHRKAHGGHSTGVSGDSLPKMEARDKEGKLKTVLEIGQNIREFLQARNIKDTQAYLMFLRNQKEKKLDASLTRMEKAEMEIRVIDRMLGGMKWI